MDQELERLNGVSASDRTALLSRKDHEFFAEYGYVVIPNAVPQANLDAVIDAIWDFLGMDRHDPDDWYREPHRVGGMVEMYQHQALWNNRQHPRVYQAFVELLGEEKLWVSMDRACMKPPSRPDKPAWDHKGFIHWDIDTTRLPDTLGVQGVLYLADTAANQGGFQCVPGFPKRFGEWVKTQPPDRDPRRPDLSDLEVKSVPGKAGDLLIWSRLLPHGNGHNISSRPRLAQYLLMSPARENDEKAREGRLELWRERRQPDAKAFPGDPRNWERQHYGPAELTDLGKKLLGIAPWDRHA